MTAFNCASYLSLVVPSQRDGLDLLQRGGSSHRPQGNLGLSTSSYTPCIVRFCSLNPTISVCFLLVAARTLERGLSSESNSVSGPPTPSKTVRVRFAFQPVGKQGGSLVGVFPGRSCCFSRTIRSARRLCFCRGKRRHGLGWWRLTQLDRSGGLAP